MAEARDDGLYATGVSENERTGRYFVCPIKLEHDLQQIDFLLSRSLGEELQQKLQVQKVHYERALDWFEGLIPEFPPPMQREDADTHDADCAHFKTLPEKLRDDIRETYNVAFLPRSFEHKDIETKDVLQEKDWSSIDGHFWRHGYVVVDDVLKDEYLLELYRFATETSSFTKVDAPYIGAYLPQLLSPLSQRIATEIPERLPRIFRSDLLNMAWCYKSLNLRMRTKNENATWPRWKIPYGLGSRLIQGSTLHNDGVGINMNLMFGAPGAKLEGGGLQLFLCDPVQDRRDQLDIEDSEDMAARVVMCPNVTLGYKPNRLLIYAASLFHKTEDFRFKSGFENARTFMTFLYGDPRSRGYYEENAPPEYREAFLEQVFRAPSESFGTKHEL
eukprot:TRINITY_DN50417_c0_g1_i1.p1 TRINITY_DN50417_c0_g1~~TRINITY_DN50417_c0_g1_i1.p1  ORF type:complete len:444 (+),score=50.44 TRINITY_DN50417_c0_g1_i1:167-1333(+)